MKNKKVLITGISGFLGYHLYNALYKNNTIVGLYKYNYPKLPAAKLCECDISDKDQISSILNEYKFDFVFHLAAYSKTGLCEQNPNKSFSINVNGTNNIIQYCNKTKTPLLFTSTDLVFDGVKGNYSESDKPNPINIYGSHKLKAEASFDQITGEYWIARMPLLLGNAGTTGKSFLQDYFKSYKSGIPMPLFDDEIRAPITGPVAAKWLIWLTSQDKGVYHLGGKTYSRYEMGIAFSEIFKLDKSKIIRSNHDKVKLSSPRPKDLSLNCDKAKRKGFIETDCMEDLISLLPFF